MKKFVLIINLIVLLQVLSCNVHHKNNDEVFVTVERNGELPPGKKRIDKIQFLYRNDTLRINEYCLDSVTIKNCYLNPSQFNNLMEVTTKETANTNDLMFIKYDDYMDVSPVMCDLDLIQKHLTNVLNCTLVQQKEALHLLSEENNFLTEFYLNYEPRFVSDTMSLKIKDTIYAQKFSHSVIVDSIYILQDEQGNNFFLYKDVLIKYPCNIDY